MTDSITTVPSAPIVARGTSRALQLFDPVRQAVFLQALAEDPIVGRACRRAGITTGTAYRMKERNPAFAAAWNEALSGAVDDLEHVAMQRARDGSDQLLLRVLEAHRPELYSRKLDVKASVAVDFVVDLVPMPSSGSDDREAAAGPGFEILEGEVEELAPSEDT